MTITQKVKLCADLLAEVMQMLEIDFISIEMRAGVVGAAS